MEASVSAGVYVPDVLTAVIAVDCEESFADVAKVPDEVDTDCVLLNQLSHLTYWQRP